MSSIAKSPGQPSQSTEAKYPGGNFREEEMKRKGNTNRKKSWRWSIDRRGRKVTGSRRRHQHKFFTQQRKTETWKQEDFQQLAKRKNCRSNSPHRYKKCLLKQEVVHEYQQKATTSIVSHFLWWGSLSKGEFQPALLPFTIIAFILLSFFSFPQSQNMPVGTAAAANCRKCSLGFNS